ncbi:MAG TPA: hypothetical protein PLQ97_00485 [Myxococcota bacterium]|nr:hypothetical protein [Myxococcota bacterium]HQK49650.1 hypothetical protein [Myxococcota bacterium]
MASTILWTRNRGVQAMTRVILARRGERPLVVETLAALRTSAAERLPGVLITTDEDLETSGLDPASLDRLFPGVPTLVVCSGRRPLPSPVGPRMRVIPLPFSAADLLDALPAPGGPRSPEPPGPAAPEAAFTGTRPPPESASVPADPVLRDRDLQALVQQEVRKLLEASLREWVQRTVREVVPELAESLIREELERLLRESEEAALQGPVPEDSESPPRK